MRTNIRLIQTAALIIFLLGISLGCAKKSSKAAAGAADSTSSSSGSTTFSISGLGQS